ncbi:MAG: hypothetical protein U0Z44_08825 [Kouleothrix sp.]
MPALRPTRSTISMPMAPARRPVISPKPRRSRLCSARAPTRCRSVQSKSQLGHLVGAAGSIEAVVTILALQNGLLPPTINLHTPDPECDLDYVPNAARPAPITTAMSNSFGFGGHNVSLVFRRLSSAGR